MGLIALGINHKTAELALRERLIFAPEQMVDALHQLCDQLSLPGAVILSTCNRTEVFVCSEGGDAAEREQHLLSWLADYHHMALDNLQRFYYCHHQQQALRHMVNVASGLDSMVLGEPQIFGQIKSAFAVAQEAGSVDAELARVFSWVFATAKKIRTDTAIGENPVSVAFAAVNLSKHIFADLGAVNALLVGAGETIELVARHLQESGVQNIVVANRTQNRAAELASRFKAEAVLLSAIPDQLAEADIVISSTGSQLPILGKGAVESALKLRKHRPILMVDIAVPRDIESEVGELNDVYLYTIDDLTEIVDENRRSRENEARKADKLIDESLAGFERYLRSLEGVDLLKNYRNQTEQARDIELEKALKQLAKGEQPEQVVAQLARNLTNKLMHQPSMGIRKASAEGKLQHIEMVQQLFGLQLNDDENETPS